MNKVTRKEVIEPCEVIVSRVPGQKVSDEQVSPAVSLAISPSTDENYKTESDGNQPSNKSGNRSKKPNCHDCKYGKSIPGDSHLECVNAEISEIDRIITGFALLAGQRSAVMKRMNISADEYGIKNGWFYWPLNFDPVWLESCDGFKYKYASAACCDIGGVQ